MKRLIGVLLAVFLLLSMAVPAFAAGEKAQTTRAIAIVFDNSGSMYVGSNQAWCRATYAMEVFASMLNDGDTLMIYPMHPIQVDGKDYSQTSPLTITDPKQSSQIRKIYTDDPQGTPIECLDAAAQGLRGVSADEKWLIVLTDGDTFDQDGFVFSDTAGELGNHINSCVGDMNVLYLGIGRKAALPTGVDSDKFAAEKASDSKDVLSVLTKMCNQIFGRDTLPASGNDHGHLNFDISMKKLIVFVQGENVTDVSVTGTGGPAGTLISSSETKYATDGCNKNAYTPVSDTSLQGMLVTYEDCPAGEYIVNYSGNATSIEAYYEPDADLDFVFTNDRGVAVDPSQALYEGEYKVSYGIKDARTGELIDSDLLGEPYYEGLYSLDGNKSSGDTTPIQHKGMSGEEPVSLKVGNIFYAKMTVTYLSGYKITKDSIDFGWPEIGIGVVPMPPDTLELKITPPENTTYQLSTLEEGAAYTAEVFYGGEKLTGSELEKVNLKWDPDTSNAEIKQSFEGDHFDLTMHYKDSANPTGTVCGPCAVTIYAFYTAQGSEEAQAEAPLSYTIEDTTGGLNVNLTAPQDYFVVSELADGESLRADITVDGEKLTDEELQDAEHFSFSIDCGGLDCETTLIPGESAYAIRLLPTDNAKTGKYKITAAAHIRDELGRDSDGSDTVSVEISSIPQWLRTLLIVIPSLLLLLLLIYLLFILPVMPQAISCQQKTVSFTVGSDEIGGNAKITNGKKYGKTLSIEPPKSGDYFYSFGMRLPMKPMDPITRQPSRTRRVKVKESAVISAIPSNVTEFSIDKYKFERDEETRKITRKGSKPGAKKDDEYLILKNGSPVKMTGIARDRKNRSIDAFFSAKLLFK